MSCGAGHWWDEIAASLGDSFLAMTGGARLPRRSGTCYSGIGGFRFRFTHPTGFPLNKLQINAADRPGCLQSK